MAKCGLTGLYCETHMHVGKRVNSSGSAGTVYILSLPCFSKPPRACLLPFQPLLISLWPAPAAFQLSKTPSTQIMSLSFFFPPSHGSTSSHFCLEDDSMIRVLYPVIDCRSHSQQSVFHFQHHRIHLSPETGQVVIKNERMKDQSRKRVFACEYIDVNVKYVSQTMSTKIRLWIFHFQYTLHPS